MRLFVGDFFATTSNHIETTVMECDKCVFHVAILFKDQKIIQLTELTPD